MTLAGVGILDRVVHPVGPVPQDGGRPHLPVCPDIVGRLEIGAKDVLGLIGGYPPVAAFLQPVVHIGAELLEGCAILDCFCQRVLKLLENGGRRIPRDGKGQRPVPRPQTEEFTRRKGELALEIFESFLVSHPLPGGNPKKIGDPLIHAPSASPRDPPPAWRRPEGR